MIEEVPREPSGLVPLREGSQFGAHEHQRGAGEMDSLQDVANDLLKRLPPGPAIPRYEAEWQLAFALSANDDAIGAIAHAQQGLLIAYALRDTSRMLGSLYQLTKFNVEGRHYEEAEAPSRRRGPAW